MQDVEAINTDQESGFILTSNKQTKNGHLNTYSRLVKNQVEMSDSSTYECKATIQSHPSHRMTVEVFDSKCYFTFVNQIGNVVHVHFVVSH